MQRFYLDFAKKQNGLIDSLKGAVVKSSKVLKDKTT
jgi:hypothetical protein